MNRRKTILLTIIPLLIFIMCPDAAAQTERVVDTWIRESMHVISQKIKVLSAEYDDPFFVPKVIMGPIVTSFPGRKRLYESQLDLLLKNSIYLKLAAGLAEPAARPALGSSSGRKDRVRPLPSRWT